MATCKRRRKDILGSGGREKIKTIPSFAMFEHVDVTFGTKEGCGAFT